MSGWKESVEQHQTVGAGPVELARHVAERGEERGELDRDRDLQLVLQILNHLPQAVLDGGGGLIRIGDDLVHVELDRIGARLLDQPGEFQPRGRCRPVEGSNHRNLDGALDPTQMLQIRVRAERVLLRLGEIGHDRGELGIERIHLMNPARLGLRDLLLEERVQHDRRAARILEPPDRIQVIRER